MAASLPQRLKTADVQRFAKRAAQLEKFRPIVTYWCQYYILQQIMAKQLHTADEECSNFAIQLMDKLEAEKEQSATNDAIIDDVAAKAYIENFALETFKRADDSQRNDKVTLQTADTFQAASTFLDLLSIWGEVDKEIAAKSKFAKYHARRILKAIKNGEDPNASNPVVVDALDTSEANIDTEMKDLERELEHPAVDSSVPAADVASANHETDPLTHLEAKDYLVTTTTSEEGEQPFASVVDTSSVEPTQHQENIEYFPKVPPAEATTPIQTDTLPHVSNDLSLPHASSGDVDVQNFYTADVPPTSGVDGPAVQPTAPPSVQSVLPRTPLSNMPAPIPQATTAAVPGAYRTDDEATMDAQKHAKWAISALNFEDVNTAVKELRLALQSLGAA